ncbi:MAG TPA: TatD family hydrolase [Arachnia sp.]|nr:TatD family hydrolase [Arachnia sp.]HMT86616.1 TatD family hydrolase [Arachnia sp.]
MTTIAQDLEALGLPGLPEPLPRAVIDNHTHADETTRFSRLDVDLSLRAAAAVGVSRIVQVGCDVASSRYAVALAEARPEVVAAVAMHPNDAARRFLAGGSSALEADLAAIEALVPSPGVRAVGETGLDYYRTREPEARAAQEVSFRAHIGWAKATGKTLVVHDRDAHDDILRVLDDEGAPERFVMHCFSGDADFALRCVERGAWLSFPGVTTYPSAPNLREAALAVPADRLLVETDAPYLTPKPARGRPNAPYLLPHTVRFLADLLDADLADFCDQLTVNTFAAYGGQWGTR